MRRWILCGLLAVLAALLGASATAEEALPEWTFMLYMCGSDLESEYGLASFNLREIASLWFPEKVMTLADEGLSLQDWQPGKVNLLVETGGAKAWHSLEADGDGNTLGVQIAADRLQRYAFDMAYVPEAYGNQPLFHLVEERPLESMGAPETLADFIRWSVANYPAKKYGLLLWDHGGGSRTGIFVDELFDNDILYLYELGAALAAGGTRFELLAIDACLMCSLETARTVAPYAQYMVASEEVVAGNGSAFGGWVYELLRNPGCSGAELGYEFCDASQRKYAENEDTLAESQLTFSLIDLTDVDEVCEGFDRLFDYAGRLYESYPTRFNMFFIQLITSESYGADSVDMIDLGSFLYNDVIVSLLDADIRNDLARALNSAVEYNIKGSGRSGSKGLSFCYCPNMTAEEMNIYALNAHSAPYLALLDAVNPQWQAPEWVYETARRLTPVEQTDKYRVTPELVCREGQLPMLHLSEGVGAMYTCVFNLYAMDEDLGMLYSLGNGNALLEFDEQLEGACYLMDDSGRWPFIENEPCCTQLLYTRTSWLLFNVPLQLDNQSRILRLKSIPMLADDRIAYHADVLGLWPGYDQDTRMANRAIISLPQMQGREYKLLYPCFDANGSPQHQYRTSPPMTMPRALLVEYKPLPAGEYYGGFTVTDIFQREYKTRLFRLRWDGEAFAAVE